MRFQAVLAVRRQRGIDHFRPQIGTADTDVDDVGDGFAGETGPGAGTHLLGKYPHFC